MPTPDRNALWGLKPGVHAVRVGAEMVILDVEADRYLCLPQASEVIRLHPRWRALEIGDATLARELRDGGLIVAPGAPLERCAEPPPRPTSSALCDLCPRPRRSDVGPMARAVADVLLHYRGRSFADILRLARAGRRSPDPPTRSPDLHAAVQAFQRWIPYAPLSGKCLLRSFVLLRLLQLQGLDAQWVFGVATWPFRAHCWLQCGELALDEQIDRLDAYTPILVV